MYIDEVENPPTINHSLPNIIPELFRAHSAYDGNGIRAPTPMVAIGVRYTSMSEIRIASVDGHLATFTDFRRSESTPHGTNGLRCAERLSLGVPHLLFATALARSSPSEWLSSFYSSVGKHPPDYRQQDYMSVGNQIGLRGSTSKLPN
ncbi:hypothetical protein SCAR479_02550 [Seiridium cardinale]|uniref:Uncharacterized protein n=1 Tax=Seiridium cardinale TaxID=138064 RepID=A0ABR2Y3Q3_9PEZI